LAGIEYEGVHNMLRTVIHFVLTILIVISASIVSNYLWAGKKEELPENIKVTIGNDMTVGQFGREYNLSRPVLRKIFDLQSPDDLNNKIADYRMNDEQLSKKVNQILAIQAEHTSKNWFKIPLKGGLWIVFLVATFFLLRKGKVNSKSRKWIYAAAVVIFGIILGSDPSPMGTVKDAIVLYGSRGVIYPPRLIAFGLFVLMVIIANKFICSWGCQIGTLQDFIFRLNRNPKDKEGLYGQIKVPFVISNSIRITFFALLIIIAFAWATDIIETIDPFKIFKPQVIGIAGGVFIGVILVLSLFIYRPWCHFFCPFGLVGWLVEKISIFKIKVNYDKCISCQACSKACPSTVMDAILKQNRIIPDCFSCGTCIETCPVNAITFGHGKRQKPPTGKFD
jgi:NAD-dependent dihydropyrimidine dehydrogenase PreA subunit/ABC-type Fe3+-siderophore transport system permease subunit